MGRRSKKPKPPLQSPAQGPDKKGRYWLPIPNGKKLFFYSGAPGEEALVRRGRRGRRGEQGDLLEVVSPRPGRREARCLHYGVCGGCTMQHIEEAEALELKSQPLYEELARLVPTVEILPPVPSPRSFAYRTKVELSFMGDNLGFHRRGRFDRSVDVERCWLTPLPSQLLKDLRAWSRRHSLVGWDPRNNVGDLRYLLYRHASCSEQDLAAIVINSNSELSGSALAELTDAFQNSRVDSALVLRQSSVAGAVVPDSQTPLYGPQVLEEELGHLKFELSWKSFYQVNPRAYLKLLETLKRWRTTPPGSRILDLFCGVGSIGLYLVEGEDQLLGVELVEEAVADAKINAQRNGIKARFEAQSAEQWQDMETDLLVLDPPRSGCHPKLLKLLRERAPAQELFYISCNPHRLMEELPDLLQCYELLKVQAFDFFPQTHHLELLLQFRKR